MNNVRVVLFFSWWSRILARRFSVLQLWGRYNEAVCLIFLGLHAELFFGEGCIFANLREATVSSVLSIRPPACKNSARAGSIFVKFDIGVFFLKIYITAWCLILLRMRNVTDRGCRENQNTQFMFRKLFFFRKSYRLWKREKKYGRVGQTRNYNIIGRMRIACWITKGKMHPCTGTEALYRPYGPWGE
jgi:hypothetical protein